ncbi:MAG: transposase, partial [Turicibacter sp.]|nr:transposase [Turicibacter sp.]
DSEELEQYTYTNDAPVDENGVLVTYDNKKHNLDSTQYKQQAEGRKKKQQLIRNVQMKGVKSESITIEEIAEAFNISQSSARKYLQMTEEEVLALDSPKQYKKRKTVMDDYLNMIYKMLHDKIDPAKIFSYVLRKGYCGSYKTLENYIVLLAKNNFNRKFYINFQYKKEYPQEVTIIKRSHVISWIVQKKSEETNPSELEHYMNLIQEHFNIVTVLKEVYEGFYSILMGKDPEQLDKFIETYELSPIKGFINGIKKDIDPVKNAISHSESSGFVEGNNNKFKLLKRILYGRAHLVNLFKKCYTAFQVKRKGFRIQNLLEMDELT